MVSRQVPAESRRDSWPIEEFPTSPTHCDHLLRLAIFLKTIVNLTSEKVCVTHTDVASGG